MSNLTLKDRIKKYFTDLIPVRRITVYDPRAMPGSIGQSMDVDRIHQILESAQAGGTLDLFALYRDILMSDAHLQGELSKRKRAVLGDSLSIQPFDKNVPEDVAAAKAIEEMVNSCSSWLMACSHLLDSCLWPVALIEKVFRPSSRPGLRFELAELTPVPAIMLDYARGRMMVRDMTETGFPMGTFHDPDPMRYMVHRGHLLTTPDNWGGPMRSLVFWWLLSSMDRDWWGRFLEKYGSPFLVGKYDQADDASRSILERAFSYAVRIGGLVISKETEVELQQAAAGTSGDAYEKFLTICQREKSKLILGQTLSAEAQSTGLNSGVSNMQEGVRQDVRQFDAMVLNQTVRTQLFEQYLRINGLPGRAPKAIWGSDTSQSIESLSQVLEALTKASLQPTDDSLKILSERLGFQIQRAPAAAPPALPFSARSERPLIVLSSEPRMQSRIDGTIEAGDSIAAAGAADLARAFRGSLAPIRRIILESASAHEAETKIRAFYADWSPEKVAPLIEQALIAFAANGSVAHAK